MGDVPGGIKRTVSVTRTADEVRGRQTDIGRSRLRATQPPQMNDPHQQLKLFSTVVRLIL